MIADHYLDKLDLSADLKDEVSQRIESAAETEDVINVLKAAYGEALEELRSPRISWLKYRDSIDRFSASRAQSHQKLCQTIRRSNR